MSAPHAAARVYRGCESDVAKRLRRERLRGRVVCVALWVVVMASVSLAAWHAAGP